MKKNFWFYDIESWPNFFSVTFWNKIETKEFIIYKDRNDLFELVKFITDQKDLVLVGYNSISYDNTIINYLLSNHQRLGSFTSLDITSRINTLSGYIINFDKLREKLGVSAVQEKEIQKTVRDYRKTTAYQFIDLLEVIREGYSTKSLKGVAINLNWPKIQDLPLPYDHIVQDDEVEEIMKYNFNDVAITARIFDHLADRLEMREILSEQFNINLRTDADSGIAKTLFNKLYTDASGEDIEEIKYKRTKRTELYLHEVILPWVEFKTPEFNEWFEQLKQVHVWNIDRKVLKEGYEEDEFGVKKKKKKTSAVQFDIPPLKYEGMEYTIGLGGIHSVDKPQIFEADEEHMLLDVDVNSQYPNRILESEIVPAHLNPKVFIPIFRNVVETRLRKKKEGKLDKIARIIAEGLKITINTVYGLYNFMYYWLYDPKATYAVTINNQLAILMLIEELNLNGIRVISANTDGIIIHSKHSNLEKIRGIYRVWEQKVQFTLEETFYSKYIRRDINNYITIKTDGEIKSKGIFVPQLGILKGYDKPIIAIALQEYFLYGKQPREVITTLGYEYKFVNPETPKGEQRTTNVYDYCLAQKIGDTYSEVIYRKDGQDIIQQRSLRYYASNGGGELLKVKHEVDETTGEIKKGYATLLSSSLVTVFNDYVEKEDYDINFEYYIEQTEKIIAKIEGRKWVDRKKVDEKYNKLLEDYNKVIQQVLQLQAKEKTTSKAYQLQVKRGLKLQEELNELQQIKDER
jgi:DNA polymerase elongation subunit (family B)